MMKPFVFLKFYDDQFDPPDFENSLLKRVKRMFKVKRVKRMFKVKRVKRMFRGMKSTTVTVSTKEELEAAVDAHMDEIVVEGELAKRIKDGQELRTAGTVTLDSWGPRLRPCHSQEESP